MSVSERHVDARAHHHRSSLASCPTSFEEKTSPYTDQQVM